MVVSGVPDHIISHAERVANTALAMLEVTEEVTCPYNYDKKIEYNPVQVNGFLICVIMCATLCFHVIFKKIFLSFFMVYLEYTVHVTYEKFLV